MRIGYGSTGRQELMTLLVEIQRETDGRWIAEVPDLPGVMVYGGSADDATAKVRILAARVVADRLEHAEAAPRRRL